VKYKYIILFAADIILLCIVTYFFLEFIYTSKNLMYEILSGAAFVACVVFAYLTYSKFEKQIFD
jgi:hypothetical protein